jgi:hypothetical protein
VASPEASVALQARGGVGSDRVAPSNRRAAAGPNSSPVLPTVGIVLLWILLSRWWSFFTSNAGRGGLPVVWCIGQRGKTFPQNVRRATSGGRSAGVLTAYPGEEIRTPKLRRMFDVTRFRAEPGERREPERSEAEPNPRRTNSLQHGCFYSGGMVRQTRAEFRPGET